MSPAPAPRWLLIGNSRWHWVERTAGGGLRGWDGSPVAQDEAGGAPLAPGPPPVAWAAVGPHAAPGICRPERQVKLEEVPLRGCPAWLGIDRALAGWGAWRAVGEAVLVVDGGTVLSLTRVDGQGSFRGGRLLAGMGLQLEAMARATTRLPDLLRNPWAAKALEEHGEQASWPLATAAAMRLGVEAGLAAAVVEAAGEAAVRRVVVTGGDGEVLYRRVAPALEQQGMGVTHRPLLCLESLAELRPAAP